MEAELLVGHAIGLDRLGLYLVLDRPLDPKEMDMARDLVSRRAKGEPSAYLLGYKEFYGRRFDVGPGVLIPRPETELLVDRARAIAEELEPVKTPTAFVAGVSDQPAATEERRITACDIGTGSGCIAITVALEVPLVRMLAIDICPDALAIAKANAEVLEVPKTRLGFKCGDGFEVIAGAAPDGVDLLLSNPPYIDSEDRTHIAADVLKHEPRGALFSPQGDPDYWARLLMERRARLLTPRGRALVELGFDQAPRLEKLARDHGVDFQIHADLNGIPRLLEFGR
ncbi:MAG: release factor glutamine methyltransferase [Planctomycetota bacterium]|jgi:release factor glutamine methyltransferase